MQSHCKLNQPTTQRDFPQEYGARWCKTPRLWAPGSPPQSFSTLAKVKRAHRHATTETWQGPLGAPSGPWV
ncbi:hypothetical protein QQF64_017948 [Cirrhinus molitorella]|uniref:Uncharacterized protein n=1 Tax=Cirrhinus molitorella TaxID=172907 RepID=A0ABR3LLN7_9TELE